jgi:transposase
MESEKAVINWEEIVNFEPVAVEENSGDLPVEAIVEELQSVTTKEHYEAVYLNVSQASMTAAWNALTQDIRDIITGLLNETQTNVCTIA